MMATTRVNLNQRGCEGIKAINSGHPPDAKRQQILLFRPVDLPLPASSLHCPKLTAVHPAMLTSPKELDSYHTKAK